MLNRRDRRSIDLREQVVDSALRLAKRIGNWLLAGEARDGFLADDSLDRILPEHIIRQRTPDRRQRSDIGAVRKRFEAWVVQHRVESGNMAGACPIVIVRGHELEKAGYRVALLR